MDSYAYIVSNNKIEPILAKIRGAARPERVTIEVLKKWGFPSSNDRAMLRILKALGAIDENNGAPTEIYDRLRDPNIWRYVLADRLKETYAELFSIDEKINSASDSEVKGAFSRITGKDEAMVNRYFATFKTLATLASFDSPPIKKTTKTSDDADAKPRQPDPATSSRPQPQPQPQTSLHYNIQLHLPATSDVAIHNAIFKALREHLLIT